MKKYSQKSVRALFIVSILCMTLLTACQITVEPARKSYLLRSGKEVMKKWIRHHNAELRESHEADVQEALADYEGALNAMFEGDLEPMEAVWSHADDVTYMGPDGAYRMGWDEVLADWETQAEMNLGGSVEFEDVRMVAGRKLAVVHNNVTGANVDPEGNPVDVALRATVIFRNEDGAWKVIGVHTDVLPLLEN